MCATLLPPSPRLWDTAATELWVMARPPVSFPGSVHPSLIPTHTYPCLLLARSVLENFHASLAFQLMRKDGRMFLEKQNYSQLKHFRHLVIHLVLATDFANHVSILNQFSVLSNLASTTPSLPVRLRPSPAHAALFLCARRAAQDTGFARARRGFVRPVVAGARASTLLFE